MSHAETLLKKLNDLVVLSETQPDLAFDQISDIEINSEYAPLYEAVAAHINQKHDAFLQFMADNENS